MRFCNCCDDVARGVEDLFALRAPGLGDLRQDGGEAGVSIAVLGREVGAAEERLQVGREPDGHRPAAAAGGGLDEGHVDAVDVGALFAIDLDGDVVAIEEFGDAVVLERLALHDVAPVARRVADGKEDRLVFGARLFESFGAPGEPVHRIMRVLEKIWTLFPGESVHLNTPVL